MDGTASTATELRKQFRTPLRILLPKILAHRDGGKAESDAQKAHRTAANVTLRDLRISRDYWRRRTAQAEAATSELRDRRTQAERDRDAARAARRLCRPQCAVARNRPASWLAPKLRAKARFVNVATQLQ